MHEERSCIYGKLIYCINHLIIFLSQNLSEAVDVALAIQDSAKEDRKGFNWLCEYITTYNQSGLYSQCKQTAGGDEILRVNTEVIVFVKNSAYNKRKITMRANRQGIGSVMLFLALSIQIILLTHAAPMDCQKNTAVCLEEIMKEMTQVRFELNILTENRTLIRPTDCAELYKSGRTVSGVYAVDPDGSGAFNVYCDQTTAGGGWTVFQKRIDGSVDFNRTWDDYKHGFGNLVGEFWLGLDKINRLTQNKTKNKLRVDLRAITNKIVHPEYDWFGIATETNKYRLYIGKMTTNATVCPDSLSQHNNFDFGIWERGPADRVQKRGVGWWYDEGRENAVHSNLNGIYPLCGSETAADIHWGHLAPKRGAAGSAPKSSEMKIRPVDFF